MQVAEKTTVIGVLAALINFSAPVMFGAAVTGSLVYYVMFADRGKWSNIALFLISIPLSLHLSPVIALKFGLDNLSGVALICGAVGLLAMEKLAAWIRNPANFIKTMKEVKGLWRSTAPTDLPKPPKGEDQNG